jgi:hypothetical protein
MEGFFEVLEALGGKKIVECGWVKGRLKLVVEDHVGGLRKN